MSDIDDVVDALRDGELAIFETDTLWSLSARAFDPEAAQKIFKAKQRPEGVPLAVGFPSWGMASQYVHVTPAAQKLAREHLPGPVSIVLKRRGDQLAHVAPGRDTISIRVPDNEIALHVLEHVGPCIMTSANLHGHEDATSRPDVAKAFPDVPIAGDEVRGLGSTVVDATGDKIKILRPGVLRLDV